MKRIFDLFFSFLGILFLLPIYIIIAILIKIDSNGDILYKQERIGKNGIPFYVLKFRTMIPNAFSKGALTVGSRDPRVTNIGFYLRKYKLDELPQLFNVFLGEMSFVGPRPEVREYTDLYDQNQKKVEHRSDPVNLIVWPMHLVFILALGSCFCGICVLLYKYITNFVTRIFLFQFLNNHFLEVDIFLFYRVL